MSWRKDIKIKMWYLIKQNRNNMLPIAFLNQLAFPIKQRIKYFYSLQRRRGYHAKLKYKILTKMIIAVKQKLMQLRGWLVLLISKGRRFSRKTNKSLSSKRWLLHMSKQLRNFRWRIKAKVVTVAKYEIKRKVH